MMRKGRPSPRRGRGATDLPEPWGAHRPGTHPQGQRRGCWEDEQRWGHVCTREQVSNREGVYRAPPGLRKEETLTSYTAMQPEDARAQRSRVLTDRRWTRPLSGRLGDRARTGGWSVEHIVDAGPGAGICSLWAGAGTHPSGRCCRSQRTHCTRDPGGRTGRPRMAGPGPGGCIAGSPPGTHTTQGRGGRREAPLCRSEEASPRHTCRSEMGLRARGAEAAGASGSSVQASGVQATFPARLGCARIPPPLLSPCPALLHPDRPSSLSPACAQRPGL